MSLNPVPSSLKSSTGSKSSTPPIAGSAPGGSFRLRDERSGTFRSSSWVSRLHPRLLSRPPAEPPPPPTPHPPLASKKNLLPANAGSGAPLGVGTVSNDRSRTRTSISNPSSSFAVRRYFNLLEQRAAGVIAPPRPPAPPPFVVGDGGDRSVDGFGPFQVRPRSCALPPVGQERLGGGRILGNECCGEGGGYFPLFRRMARLEEGSDEQRGNLGSRVGRQPFVDDDNRNACFATRSAPVGHNQVKLSPFFHFRQPQPNSTYSSDWNRGLIRHPMGGRSTAVWNYHGQMRPSSSENWNSPAPVSYFPPQGVAGSNPFWRQYERNSSVDQWYSSASADPAARSRGTCYLNRADEPASTSTSRKLAVNHLERTAVLMNEPEEPISRWNMGRFKRSAKFDDSLPLKFRKLSNDD